MTHHLAPFFFLAGDFSELADPGCCDFFGCASRLVICGVKWAPLLSCNVQTARSKYSTLASFRWCQQDSTCSTVFEQCFLNSLIIHQAKRKKITTVEEVWKCDLNYHKILWTFASNFSKNYQYFEKLYQTLERVFPPISKHLEVG